MRSTDFSPQAYTDGLTFATEVTDAATHIAYGDHGANRLRKPFLDELAHHEGSWSWSDNRHDEWLISGGPLRATVLYLAGRHALGTPSLAGDVTAVWPDVKDRLAALRRALMVAVTAAEEAYAHELGALLAAWLRTRLDAWLVPPAAGEPIGPFEARIRHAVVVCHRYHDLRYELFGDRTWEGRPEAPWRCPDTDLVVRSPFDGHCTGQAPTYALQVTTASTADVTGTFTVANHYRTPPVHYPVAVRSGVVELPDDLADDDVCAPEVAAAFRALGHRPADPPPRAVPSHCPHRWV